LKCRDLGTILRGTVKPWYCRVYDDKGEWEVLWEQANLDDLMSENEDRYRFMLRFAISHPNYSTVIIGTKNPDHLRANVQTVTDGPLPDDVYTEAKRRLDAFGMTAG